MNSGQPEPMREHCGWFKETHIHTHAEDRELGAEGHNKQRPCCGVSLCCYSENHLALLLFCVSLCFFPNTGNRNTANSVHIMC